MARSKIPLVVETTIRRREFLVQSGTDSNKKYSVSLNNPYSCTCQGFSIKKNRAKKEPNVNVTCKHLEAVLAQFPDELKDFTYFTAAEYENVTDDLQAMLAELKGEDPEEKLRRELADNLKDLRDE